MKISSLAAAATLLASAAGAQEPAPQNELGALLLQNFDFASAEKITCDPQAEKLPCILDAWKKAAETGKTVVAFHMAPERQTMSVIFPDGIVVELEPDRPAGQPADYPAPAI